MATNLTFTKKGIWNECQLNPSVPITIQVQLKERATFDVREYIGDLEPVTVFSTSAYDNIIFEVDVPEGVSVLLATTGEVIKAVMI